MTDPLWTQSALHPTRAFDAPVLKGRLRAEPEDFVVEEDLGFDPAGAGQHVLVRVRKRNANTEWVARELARIVQCKPFDVGFAGLKDRRALTTQWFSLPASAVSRESLTGMTGQDFEILEAHAHTRKLPRGALAANIFSIRIRDAEGDDAQLTARLNQIRDHGVPNYFGAQRFGRGGANLGRIDADLRSLQPKERPFILSAARSVIFNAVLAERVREQTWNKLEPGDVANLDGKGSIFAVEALDESMTERLARLDVHPTGPMWGSGELASGGRINDLEARVAAGYARPCALTVEAGMRQERRSLRLAVRDLSWERENATDLVIRFRLTRGSFATTVLKEIVDAELQEEGETHARDR